MLNLLLALWPFLLLLIPYSILIQIDAKPSLGSLALLLLIQLLFKIDANASLGSLPLLLLIPNSILNQN